MDGYIKIFRQIKDWEHFQEPSVLLLFIDLLVSANFKRGYFHGTPVGKGSLITSYRKLSDETGLSVNTIKACISKLVKSGEITIKTAKGQFTHIVINQFNKYQGVSMVDTPTDTLIDTPVDTPTDTLIDINRRKKRNIRKEEDIIIDSGDKSPKRAKFQKPTLQELQEFAFAENLMNVDCNRFFDYYESNGWKVGRNAMKDWRATLRNWNRTPQNPNNQQFNNKNYGNNQQTDAERLKVPHIGTFTDEQFDAICEMGRLISEQNAINKE